MFDWSKFKNSGLILLVVSSALIFANDILKQFGIVLDSTAIMQGVKDLLYLLWVLGIVTTPPVQDAIVQMKNRKKKSIHAYGRQYKLQRDTRPVMEHEYFIHSGTTLPKVDLRPLCPDVFDQEDLGSCTANAGVFAMMWALFVKLKKPCILLSRLFMYYMERKLNGQIKEDAGATIKDECIVAAEGVCEETYDTYDISKFTVAPTKSALANALLHKITSYKAVKGLSGIKAVLASGYPVCLGMTVFESFEGTAIAGTGKMPIPKKGEEVKGGHAVAAVGYDDSIKCLIVRNSWGSGWGDKGYFYMPYDFVSLTMDGQPCVYDCWMMQ
jgi:C1A family cysteine protease